MRSIAVNALHQYGGYSASHFLGVRSTLCPSFRDNFSFAQEASESILRLLPRAELKRIVACSSVLIPHRLKHVDRSQSPQGNRKIASTSKIANIMATM